MSNDSSTGGYLLPTGTAPINDEALDDLFRDVISAVTGLVPRNVVRRFNAEPGAPPQFDGTWAAVGVLAIDDDDFPYQALQADDTYKLVQHEVLQVMASFYGFPAIGIKSAMVSAARYVDAKMTVLRGAFHIDAEILTVIGEPRPREDMVTVGLGTADIRYRPEFPEWRIPVTIKYNASAISPEQIANLLNVAGFGVGIGEWRPERNGSYGRFHVGSADE